MTQKAKNNGKPAAYSPPGINVFLYFAFFSAVAAAFYWTTHFLDDYALQKQLIPFASGVLKHIPAGRIYILIAAAFTLIATMQFTIKAQKKRKISATRFFVFILLFAAAWLKDDRLFLAACVVFFQIILLWIINQSSFYQKMPVILFESGNTSDKINLAAATVFLLSAPVIIGAHNLYAAVAFPAALIIYFKVFKMNRREFVLFELTACILAAAGSLVFFGLENTQRERSVQALLLFFVFFGLAQFEWAVLNFSSKKKMIAAACVTFLCTYFPMNFVLMSGPWSSPQIQKVKTYVREHILEGRNSRIYKEIIPPGALQSLPLGWWIEIDYFSLGRPSKEKAPDTFRIIAQGSSATDAGAVTINVNSWTQSLEKTLNENGYPYHFEVVNAGIGGSTSFGMLINFKEVLLDYHPDMLLLYTAHSDATYGHGAFTEKELLSMAEDGVFDSAYIAESFNNPFADERKISFKTSPKEVLGVVLNPMTFFSSLNAVFHDIPGFRSLNQGNPDEEPKSVRAVPPEDFLHNMNSFVELCREHNIRLVFVGEASQDNISNYQDIMSFVARENRLMYYNADEALSMCANDKSDLMIDRTHLTPAGNICVGSAIARALIENSQLPENIP